MHETVSNSMTYISEHLPVDVNQCGDVTTVFSREILTLKQQITIGDGDSEELSAEVATAEKRYEDLKQEAERRAGKYQSLVDARDAEIQKLRNKIQEMPSSVFEKRLGDLQRESSQRIKDLEDNVAVKCQEVRTLRNKIMENSEEKEALETQMRRDACDDETVMEIGQLVDLVRGEMQVIKDSVGNSVMGKPVASTENAGTERELRDIREEKQRLESKVLRLTIEKMRLKRKLHDSSN